MIGTMIKKLRKARLMTQHELANESGLFQKQISEYESGRFEPSFTNLKKIASGLRVRVEDLAKYYDGQDS